MHAMRIHLPEFAFDDASWIATRFESISMVHLESYEDLGKCSILGLQTIPYDLNLSQEQIKKYNRRHKTKLEAADDGKTYLPKGSYTLLWNDSKISTLTIE